MVVQEKNMSKLPSIKKQYIMGARAGVPVVFGFIPVGIAYAIMARQAGLSIAQTCFMSLTVFAGASQMMAAGMFAKGAGIAAIILTTFILNLRHIIMSVCVMRRMKNTNLAARLIAAFGITDESFAIYTTIPEQSCTASYFFGLITVTYSSWNVGTLIGAVASDFLPAIVAASFGIALYAMFIALLVPSLTGNARLGILVAVTALCNTVLSQFTESSSALIISTLLCAFIGVFFVDLKEDTENEHS